jgi:hypothetical protein
MGGTLRLYIKYQNSEFVFMFLDPKIVAKKAVIFVLGYGLCHLNGPKMTLINISISSSRMQIA